VSGRIKSPCNEVCQLERKSGFCLGCGRTGAEIAAWPRISDDERDAITALLAARLDAMGMPHDPEGRREEGERRARAQRMGETSSS
jgi:uncharacterized protein